MAIIVAIRSSYGFEDPRAGPLGCVDGVRSVVVGDLEVALLELGEEDDVVGEAKATDEPGLEIRGLVLGVVEDGGDQAAPGVGFAGLERRRPRERAERGDTRSFRLNYGSGAPDKG